MTPALLPPTEGPGGPILVVSSSANPFSRYYVEILRAEGLNEFAALDISQVSSATLASYEIVVLGEFPLTAGEVTMFTNWVSAGGNLIAMRPDKQLALILGLIDTGATLSNGYLLLNTATGPGVGLVNQTIQFHGTADLYTLGGATSLATLYSQASTATASPAVTLASFGTGQAAAFTYDLARSVVYTRQGNPAWSGSERDGTPPIRSDDLFFGAAASDPQPDWVDLSKVAIPQADEQQRMLANLILEMNQTKMPLPRFWYFPQGFQAVVIMTGDDHGNGGTVGRFDTYVADSASNCSVANWQCVRGTSYIYPGTPITNAQAKAFADQGFEIALHVDTNCADWTPTTLEGFYSSQLSMWSADYLSLPAPQTNRTHCIVWSDYDTQPQVELNHGIRLDTNYYYWPPSWVQDRPGMFTGSGMPMRFAKIDGTLIDVYQATTQMTDESGQSYPFTIDTLLDNALGPTGYYGAFTANMHNDSASSSGADAIVASAQARNVPIITSLQMLQWLDGRNSSSFGSFSWSSGILSFTVSVGAGANGIQAMLPTLSSAGRLAGISLVGSPVSYATQTIKGITYAVFSAAPGTYTATYAPDTTPPVISSIAAAPSENGTATITWNTDKLSSSVVNYGTNSSSLTLQATAPGLTISHSVQLTGLAANTTYYFQVTSTDGLGNTATAPATPASFLTPTASLSDSSQSDFASGSGSCSALRLTTGGEVILTPAVDTEFSGSSLPTNWSSNLWASGGGVSVGGGAVTVDGADIATNQSYAPGVSLEFVAAFSGQAFQHVGFAKDLNFDSPWIIFSTGSTGGALYARIFGSPDVLIPGSWLGTPHRFRIEWMANSVMFSIDGTSVSTQNVTASTSNLVLIASDATVGGGSLSVNWMRLSPYASSCSFTSRVLDAGGAANWATMSWTADTPVGTSLAMLYRIGNNPVPDSSWTGFTLVGASPATLSGNSRYIQYQANLATTDATRTPALSNVTIAYAAGAATTPPLITAESPAPGATDVPVGTSVSATFNTPMNPATITSASFQLREVGTGTVVPAAVSYNSGVAKLVPNASLSPSTLYQATVSGTVADLSGNSLGTDVSWNFTTGVIILSHTDTTVADFSAGTVGSCSVVAHIGDGEVTLAPTIDEEFSGTSLPANWSSTPWPSGGTSTISNGLLSVDGALFAYNNNYGPGRSTEFVATFQAEAFEHVGFGQTLQSSAESWALFSTLTTTNSVLLYARTNNAGTTSDVVIPGNWLGAPHRFRIDWTASNVVFSIDGTVVSTQAVAIAANMRPLVSDYQTDGTPLTVDWMLMTPYNGACSFQSAPFDAGSAVNWSTLSWTTTTPANTTLALSYRTGNTNNANDGSWSSFAPVAGSGDALAGSSRYIQYQADFSTADPNQTPVLQDVTITYSPPPKQAPAFTSANNTMFTVGTLGSFTVTTTGTPTPSLTYSGMLPTGVTFTDKGDGTATLAGTPTAGGTFNISLTAQNGVSPNATQSFTLTVHQAPAITSANSATFTVGTPGSFTVTTTGSPTPSLAYSGTLPTGVTFTDKGDGTATLAGTPAAGTGKTYNLTFTASNSVSPNATQSFTLTVNQAPAISSANRTTFVVGIAGSFPVTVTGFPAPTLGESGNLPSGVTFNAATGVLSGIPAVGSNGIYNIMFTAANGVRPGAVQNFSLTVVNPPPTLASIVPNSGLRGTNVPVTLTGTNFMTPGAKVTVSGTGVTVGTVTIVSSTTITATFAISATAGLTARNVSVTTLGGTSNTQPFTVLGPMLASVDPSSGTRGTSVPVTLTGSGLTGATAITVSGTGVTVSGLTVVNDTTITATFAITATAALTGRNVRVTTPIGNSNTVTFTIIAPPAPTLASVAPNTGARGTAVPVTLTGSNFTATGTTVTVSGSGIAVSGLTVVNGTTITATFTISATAWLTARNVSVRTPGGTSNTRTFTVQGPTLASVSPNPVTHGSGVLLTLTGTNLAGATGVTISGTGSTCTVTASTSTMVNATCTLTAGVKSVRVTTLIGTTGSVSLTVN